MIESTPAAISAAARSTVDIHIRAIAAGFSRFPFPSRRWPGGRTSVALIRAFWTLVLTAFALKSAPGQEPSQGDSLLEHGTLPNCISYAISHQPAARQAAIDEEITEHLISSKLADWYPQVLFNISAEHYWQIPVSIVGGTAIPVSLTNSSSGGFSVSQTLFNRDVLLAASTASDVRDQAKHRSTS
ncbi:MAG TPA: hypothetical protein VEO56_14685, partial [Bacteroidota bacterium]|nr:hypothetical protein [Bacteroidota bacterium]